MQDMHYMDRNLAAIRTRIREAKEESRKRFPDRDGVTLLAAVKYADTEQLRYLTEVLGIRDVGENRVQQRLEHWEALPDREDLRFHFIGTLQKNKVKYIIDTVCMIHSLDSMSLAKEIEKQAAKHNRTIDILLEVHVAQEESKSGWAWDDLLRFVQSDGSCIYTCSHHYASRVGKSFPCLRIFQGESLSYFGLFLCERQFPWIA